MKRYREEAIRTLEWEDHVKEFEPLVLENLHLDKEMQFQSLLAFLLQDSTVIDISCIAKDEVEYKGNPIDRESINLPIKSFVEAFVHLSEGKTHWLLSSELNFYLSQCCLYSSEPSTIQISLPAVHDHRPAILKSMTIDTVNLWMNIDRSQSTLHYDANHNLLLVLQGSKTIYLFSPELTSVIEPKSIFCESPNHSNLPFMRIKEISEELLKDSKYERKGFVITVNPGEAIFIPEGWWHQVESTKYTVALNYWFSSGLERLKKTNINPYVMRKVAHSMVLEYCKLSFEDERKYRLQTSYSFYSNLSLDGFAAALHQVINSHSSVAQEMQLSIVFCEFEVMKRLWLPYSSENGLLWTQFLLQLTPKSSFVLLELWDEIEKGKTFSLSINCFYLKVSDPMSQEFFSQIFLPCGEEAVPVSFLLSSKIVVTFQFILDSSTLNYAER